MRYKLFGHSGLRVSEIALGTMTFGQEWGFGTDAQSCGQILGAYEEAGGNFIDTANKYTNGSSEAILGDLLEGGRRDRFVLATKYSLSMRSGDPNACGNQRKNMVQSVEASLKRLKTDHSDLYWVHAWDFLTPVEEVMRGLDDLVRAGKILYVGVSDAPAWIVSQANTLASLRGWTPFIGLQIQYSLLERTVERDLLPMARAFDIAVCAWAPIGAGVLAGKYTRDADTGDSLRAQLNARRLTDANLKIAREVDAVADELGASSSQVAIAWTMHQHPQIIPIVGSRKLEQITDCLGAAGLTLAPAHLERLDAVSRVELGFPHDFLATPNIQDIVYGDRRHLIDFPPRSR